MIMFMMFVLVVIGFATAALFVSTSVVNFVGINMMITTGSNGVSITTAVITGMTITIVIVVEVITTMTIILMFCFHCC